MTATLPRHEALRRPRQSVDSICSPIFAEHEKICRRGLALKPDLEANSSYAKIGCTIFHNERGRSTLMIRITYSLEDRLIAEEIRDDLTNSFQLAHPVLIVLVSAAALGNAQVQAEIERARQEQAHILPIVMEKVDLPSTLSGMKALNFSGGYQRDKLLKRLTQVTMTPVDIRRANRRALAVIGAIAVAMFAVAIGALTGGVVGFPVAEYNEDATFQAQWVDGLIRETLEHVQPRTTADALNFPATHAAVPTRVRRYVRATATALAREQEN